MNGHPGLRFGGGVDRTRLTDRLASFFAIASCVRIKPPSNAVELSSFHRWVALMPV
tara:strand:- start:306 stop:473 length:168 start_codon:yes stop_codon:yes gene_type:complete